MFEALGNFEGRGWQRGDFAQDVWTVGIESDVLVERLRAEPLLAFDAPYVGDDAAAEVQGALLVVDDHFRRIGVLQGC